MRAARQLAAGRQPQQSGRRLKFLGCWRACEGFCLRTGAAFARAARRAQWRWDRTRPRVALGLRRLVQQRRLTPSLIVEGQHQAARKTDSPVARPRPLLHVAAGVFPPRLVCGVRKHGSDGMVPWACGVWIDSIVDRSVEGAVAAAAIGARTTAAAQHIPHTPCMHVYAPAPPPTQREPGQSIDGWMD